MAEPKDINIDGFSDFEPKWFADWCEDFMAKFPETEMEKYFTEFMRRAVEDETLRPYYALWRWVVKHHSAHHQIDTLSDALGIPSDAMRRAMKALGMKEISPRMLTSMGILMRGVQEGKSKDAILEELKRQAKGGQPEVNKGLN